jgi:hypothetical protein
VGHENLPQSLSLVEAQHKQFALVDAICRHFPGADFLRGGDFGLASGLNQPRVTQRRSSAGRCIPCRGRRAGAGAGTGAIRAAIAALVKPGGTLLIHDAPVYPTTR